MIHFESVWQLIVFVVVIIVLAIILQRIFNPRKNSITRKYLEMENEVEQEKSDPEKEKEFYEQIWNAKKSKR
ncbi:MAG: hypothetical protein GXO25_06230 [Euryarchaeota archaeon]|nr:hypothetical protein [Euryarchaeota archaeon]